MQIAAGRGHNRERHSLVCEVPFAVILQQGIARRARPLVYALTLGGIGNAVPLYKQETVTDVLARGLFIIFGQLSIVNYQLYIIHAIGDDADALGVNGDVATEETTIGTDRGAGGGVRVIELVVLQAEVSVAGGGALQDTCAESAYQEEVAAIRAVVIACQGGYVAVVGVGVDGHVREDESGLGCQFGVGVDNVTFARFDGLGGNKEHLYGLVIQLLCITENEDAVV